MADVRRVCSRTDFPCSGSVGLYDAAHFQAFHKGICATVLCLALRAAVLVKALSHGLKAGKAVDVTTGKRHRLREELQADGANQLQSQGFWMTASRHFFFSLTHRHGGRCWKNRNQRVRCQLLDTYTLTLLQLVRIHKQGLKPPLTLTLIPLLSHYISADIKVECPNTHVCTAIPVRTLTDIMHFL